MAIRIFPILWHGCHRKILEIFYYKWAMQIEKYCQTLTTELQPLKKESDSIEYSMQY